MAIVEGEMSIDPFLKVQISGIGGAKRVARFVHNYEKVCAGLFGEIKCFFKKIVNTLYLMTQITLWQLFLCFFNDAKDAREGIIMSDL